VRNQVALVGVIPEPADIGNQFSIVTDEGVIDCNDTVLGVAGAGVVLQQVEAPLVERLDVPLDFSQKAVQAGLVGCDRELAVDTADGFTLGNAQAS
jgi:hypothetical protein